VGLFVQIPIFSQESGADSAGDSVQEDSVIVDVPFRAAEQNMTFEDASPLPALNQRSSIWTLIRMILVLALAAAAIYGIIFLIKRSSRQAAADDPYLKILASSHLGFNRYVHIVSAGSKAWLLGASEGGVNLISEIDDKDVINSMLLDDSRKSSETQGRFPDFLSLLRRLGAPSQNRSSGVDEIRKRRERLKGM
jgi:flagellar protein FliO/FliZ